MENEEPSAFGGAQDSPLRSGGLESPTVQFRGGESPMSSVGRTPVSAKSQSATRPSASASDSNNKQNHNSDSGNSAEPTKVSPRAQAAAEKEEQAFVDEFGFELSDDEAKEREVCYVRGIDGQRVKRREGKWKHMAANWEKDSEQRFEKIKERCRKGIPSAFRGKAWQLLTGSHTSMYSPDNKGVYEALKRKKMDPELENIIDRDLGRTFPTHTLFREDRGGQEQLRGVLHAYACIDPEVGYVQGMGFIAGTLLTQMEEEETFWCLHSLMHHEKYRLRDMYRPGFPMLQLFFYQLRSLTKKEIPKLQKHFDELNVDPSFFAAQWFLTLFVYHFQFRALVRIWDIFMCEGWKIIFRACLALMKWEEKALLQMPFDQLLPALKNLHENKNPDEILERCLKVKFKTAELAKLRTDYEKGVKN